MHLASLKSITYLFETKATKDDAMETHRTTAQIIPFPNSRSSQRSRPVFSNADLEALAAPHVDVDSAWYHDAAIDAEKRNPTH
jgi:hypothetical protein